MQNNIENHSSTLPKRILEVAISLSPLMLLYDPDHLKNNWYHFTDLVSYLVTNNGININTNSIITSNPDIALPFIMVEEIQIEWRDNIILSRSNSLASTASSLSN